MMQLAPVPAAPSTRPVPGEVGTFLPQFRSPLLPDGIAWGAANGNCGPASIVNALRLVGLDVPGFQGERSQAVIDAARRLATGSVEDGVATLKTQQAFALRAAGADVHVTHSLDAGLDAVRSGAVLVLGGDRAARGWPRRSDDPAPSAVANHAVVVARALDGDPDRFVVFDPALPAPTVVDGTQLDAFTQAVTGARMPRLGLVVRAPA